MNQRRSLKELNLLDKFLFDEAMDDPENVKIMLDIILKRNREHLWKIGRFGWMFMLWMKMM